MRRQSKQNQNVSVRIKKPKLTPNSVSPSTAQRAKKKRNLCDDRARRKPSLRDTRNHILVLTVPLRPILAGSQTSDQAGLIPQYGGPNRSKGRDVTLAYIVRN